MFGAVGGALFSYNAGTIAGTYGYLPLFMIASSVYLLALAVIQLLGVVTINVGICPKPEIRSFEAMERHFPS